MRICIPTDTDMGKEAKVYGHFGSAPYFTIYDTDKDGCEMVDNSNQHHIHGTCNPIDALSGKEIDAVVCNGMGKRAIQKLNENGIRAYRASGTNVREVIEKFHENELKAMTMENACHRHGRH